MKIALTFCDRRPSPMRRNLLPEVDEPVQLNWLAIVSFTGSVAVSVGIWIGLFRVVGYWIR